ncbi:MAG TPA: bacillithiol biosynthesis BshC [Gemmatimonadaceae bacterium]|nr:bacillithiol biosynthesis BshC [Gemmatimonadaceae bacterium]
MSEPLILTRPLVAGRLTRAALAGTTPAGWYPAPPTTPAAWREHAESVRRAFDRSDWRTALAPAFEATGAAAARLDRVAAGRGIVVTAGQQPVLFGGPIYTWSKALSALAMADAVERATGVPAAPVFWAATYDADFAEASVTHVNVGPDVIAIQLEQTAAAAQAMRETPLGDTSRQIAALESAAGTAASRDVLDLIARAYRPPQTVGSAFLMFFRAMLEPLGIAVLDGGHPSVLEAARPLLAHALRDAKSVDHALVERDRAITAAGFTPEVKHVTGLSLVFRREKAARQRIPIAQAASDGGGPLEPNVLLRPVVERAILPTVAYLGGPSELAYFAQASAVAAALGAASPMPLPRWSGLIVEPNVLRILTRHQLSVDDLADPHAADTVLARARLPRDVAEAFESLRRSLDSGIDALAAADRRQDARLVPDAVVEGARHNIAHRIERLERRLVAAVKRREEHLQLELGTARASLFPLGRTQERILNLVPMLSRHGLSLLDGMHRHAADYAAGVVSPAAATAGSA